MLVNNVMLTEIKRWLKVSAAPGQSAVHTLNIQYLVIPLHKRQRLQAGALPEFLSQTTNLRSLLC